MVHIKKSFKKRQKLYYKDILNNPIYDNKIQKITYMPNTKEMVK